MAREVVQGPVILNGGPLTEKRYNIGTGALIQETSLPERPKVRSHYRHAGQDTPNFTKRRDKGELLPMTRWDQYSQKTTVDALTARTVESTGYGIRYVYSGHVPLYPAFKTQGGWYVSDDLTGYIDDPDFESLVANAAANIYSSGFDGLTFVGELHKTFRLFRNTLKRNMDNLLSGKAYNNWLEGRYGWRILVKDIIDLHEALSSFDSSRERYKQQVGYGDTSVTQSTETFTSGSGDYTYSVAETVDYSVRGSVIMDVKPPQFTFNPIVTAWELVPYSFVIDWFVGIGTWFESLSALSLSKGYTAAGGLQINVTRDAVFVSVDYDSSFGWSGDLPYETVSSVANHTLRVPTTIPKLPQIGLGLDAFKIMDLISLLLQRAR